MSSETKVRVFVSTISGNMEIKGKQEKIFMILDSKKIEYEFVDIADPTKEDLKMFMRENAKPQEGQANPLPPQVFNGDTYCGDYDDFSIALEDPDVNALEVFLKLPEGTIPKTKKGIVASQSGEGVASGHSEGQCDPICA